MRCVRCKEKEALIFPNHTDGKGNIIPYEYCWDCVGHILKEEWEQEAHELEEFNKRNNTHVTLHHLHSTDDSYDILLGYELCDFPLLRKHFCQWSGIKQ